MVPFSSHKDLEICVEKRFLPACLFEGHDNPVVFQVACVLLRRDQARHSLMRQLQFTAVPRQTKSGGGIGYDAQHNHYVPVSRRSVRIRVRVE